MLRTVVAVIVTSVLFASTCTARDRILVNVPLDDCVQLVRLELLKIVDDELRAAIAGDEAKIDAIVIPDEADDCVIKICSNGKTFFTLELTGIDASDCERLRQYAIDGNPYSKSVQDIVDATSEQEMNRAVASLRSTINVTDPEMKRAASLFIGGKLAKMEIEEPELQSFVKLYKEDLKDNLRNEIMLQDLNRNVPFIYSELQGKPQKLQLIIKDLDPEQIEDLTIGDRQFRLAWKEDKAIVIPDPKKPPRGMKDPKGLGLPQLWSRPGRGIEKDVLLKPLEVVQPKRER